MTTDTLGIAIPTLEVTETPTLLALCFTTRATLSMVPQLGYIPLQLYDDATRLGLTVIGQIQYVYDGVTGDPLNEFTLTIALPVRESEPGTLSDGFAYKSLPAFHSADYTYTGAWDTFVAMYDAFFPAFYAQGYSYTGQLREIYTVVDLEHTDRCVTKIQIGCRY